MSENGHETYTPVQKAIVDECRALGEMLIAKNRAYGNSALDPVRVFSKASPREQILVRIDDKLSRLQRGAAAGEDVVRDLLGYLVLLRVQERLGSVERAAAPEYPEHSGREAKPWGYTGNQSVYVITHKTEGGTFGLPPRLCVLSILPWKEILPRSAFVHDLKTWPESYRAVAVLGTKHHEVRVDDRNFVVGQFLRLREWDPTPAERVEVE